MDHMFYECNKLTSLNLSNFNTTSAETLEMMFSNCNSLSSLQLGEFINTHVENMRSMFYGCSELTSFDFQTFNIQREADVYEMFENCNKISSDFCVEILNFKFFVEEKKCIKSCFNEENYKFEYNNACISSCTNNNEFGTISRSAKTICFRNNIECANEYLYFNYTNNNVLISKFVNRITFNLSDSKYFVR